MRKKITVTILALAMAILTAAIIWAIVDGSKPELSDIIKIIIAFEIAISTIIKLCGGKSPSPKQISIYEQDYNSVIGNAFLAPNQKGARKKLMYAIHKFRQDEHEKALHQLDKLYSKTQTNDDVFALHMLFALILTDVGANEDAIKFYNNIIDHGYATSTVYSNLGLLYNKQGDNEKAIANYRNALRVDGNNAYAYNNLAYIYYKTQEYDMAIENAQKALEIKNNMHQAMSALCLIYYAIGNKEQSDSYFKMSVANGGNGDSLRSMLSELDISNTSEEDDNI